MKKLGITNTPDKRFGKLIHHCCVFLLCSAFSLNAFADNHVPVRDQLKRIHDRITGTAPSNATLTYMEGRYSGAGGGDAGLVAAAMSIMDIDPLDVPGSAARSKNFYNVTLKNLAAPWTNEEQTVFTRLNDYSAMVIGMVANNKDFRELLYAPYYYIGNGVPGIPAPAATNNEHYIQLEKSDATLSTALAETTQPMGSAAAGIMTTRAAARAFFVDGTNRAMFRFTMLNHLCYDLEQIKDNTRPSDRIRQDVSRSPGGDSRLYMNACQSCHAGMDPMAQAFAYYQWEYPEGGDADVGQLVHTPGAVQPKYLINSSNFRDGYATTNDAWENRWRQGRNGWLGFNGPDNGRGTGAASLGRELAHSSAFARCQVKKVFKTVCLRNPDNDDSAAFDGIVTAFQGSGYNLKNAFAESAAYCSGN